jgi:hypothetical protein
MGSRPRAACWRRASSKCSRTPTTSGLPSMVTMRSSHTALAVRATSSSAPCRSAGASRFVSSTASV